MATAARRSRQHRRTRPRLGAQAGGDGALNETAHAKVNLALHVRARRPDGYHELESLFAFCADGDTLSARVRDDGQVTLAVEGPFADGLDDGEDNLVLRAARLLRDAGGAGQGVALTLDKRLPIASGIGGGSADAAATLRLLTRVWGIRPSSIDLFTIAEQLGADVPACLGARTVFGTGVGERLAAVDVDISGLPILLANPMKPCSTQAVFAGWDGMDRGPLSPEGWRDGRNDLEPPAHALVPEITVVLEVLRALPGAGLVRMSGSGATCFALFATREDCEAAAAAVSAKHPGWWTLASTLL